MLLRHETSPANEVRNLLMRAARRRRRTADPLASAAASLSVCYALRVRMPDVIPSAENELMRFFYVVRHVERRPVTDTPRGRPSR